MRSESLPIALCRSSDEPGRASSFVIIPRHGYRRTIEKYERWNLNLSSGEVRDARFLRVGQPTRGSESRSGFFRRFFSNAEAGGVRKDWRLFPRPPGVPLGKAF